MVNISEVQYNIKQNKKKKDKFFLSNVALLIWHTTSSTWNTTDLPVHSE